MNSDKLRLCTSAVMLDDFTTSANRIGQICERCAISGTNYLFHRNFADHCDFQALSYLGNFSKTSIKPGFSGLEKMAGAGGFEPPVTGPKPVALPLGYAPKVCAAARSCTEFAAHRKTATRRTGATRSGRRRRRSGRCRPRRGTRRTGPRRCAASPCPGSRAGAARRWG